eukprot:COSAG02_NODE_75811_length_141_cov_73.690476_1_plen_23_part_01
MLLATVLREGPSMGIRYDMVIDM